MNAWQPRSEVTPEGTVAIPEEIRRKLGIEPGSVIEWLDKDGNVVVRKRGRYTSEDIHRALFGDRKPEPHTLEELNEGKAAYIREKYGRRG